MRPCGLLRVRLLRPDRLRRRLRFPPRLRLLLRRRFLRRRRFRFLLRLRFRRPVRPPSLLHFPPHFPPHSRLRLQITQRRDIAARRILEYPQVEFGNHGQHVVENIGLYPLVIHPYHRIGKEVEFHRKSRLGRLQLTHHQRHPCVHGHFVAQITFEIGPEDAEIGLMQAVDPAFAGFDAVRGIVLLDAAFGIVDIFADQVDTAVFIQHLRRTEPHAGHVDTHRALHAAASRRLHAAPVLERIAHQQVGRQRNDRIVPVLHFDGRERHLDHRTVRTVFGYGDPVPDLEHVVRRKLDARDEAEDAVAEDQHDDGRRSAQSGEQNGGRLADQDRDDEDTADQRCDSLPGLAQSVDRFVLPRRTRRDDIEGRIKQGVDKTEDRDDDVHLYQSCDNRPGFRLFIENYGEDDDQHDSADDITQPAQHGGTEQFVIPRGFGAHHDAPNPAHEHRTAQEIEKHDGQHYQGESHPTIPAVIQCGSEPEPCEQGVGPTCKERLHTVFLSNFRPNGLCNHQRRKPRRQDNDCGRQKSGDSHHHRTCVCGTAPIPAPRTGLCWTMPCDIQDSRFIVGFQVTIYEKTLHFCKVLDCFIY